MNDVKINSEITQIAPSIVIGIGGTGHDVVNSLKRQINNFLRDMPIIQFLVFDVDNKPENSILKESEFIKLNVEHPDDIIRSIDRRPELKEWWPEELTYIGDITEGAKQTRPIGRFVYFENIKRIREIILNRKDYIRQNILEIQNRGYSVSAFKVFIVNSLSGGTGSGMFLDMAFNVLDIFNFGRVPINGYTILPDIFEMNETERSKTSANTYAALLELNHFQSPGNMFKCNYRAYLPVSITRKPFDYYYIIGTDSEDEIINIKYNNAIEMIASTIFLDITSNVGLEADTARNNIDAKLRTYLEPETKKHVNAFGTFGFYSLYYPVPEIKDVCTYRYAENIIKEILKPIDNMDQIAVSILNNIKNKGIFEINDLKNLLYEYNIQKPEYTDTEDVNKDKLEEWFSKEKEKIEKNISLNIQKKREEILTNHTKMLTKEIEDIVEDASKGFRTGCSVIGSMKTFVNSQKNVLDNTSKNTEKEIKSLEENIEKTILDLEKILNSRFTLFKDKQIKRFTSAYIDFCIDYLNKYIDSYKERDLKILYTELLNLLSDLEGNLNEIERKLIQIQTDVADKKEKAIHQLKIGRSFQLEKWLGNQQDNIIDEAYGRHTIPLKDGKWKVCQNVLYDWKDYEIKDINLAIEDFSGKQYENVNLHIEDVIRDLPININNILRSSRIQMLYSPTSAGLGFRSEDLEDVDILGVPVNMVENIHNIVRNSGRENQVRVIPIKSNIRISNVIYKYGLPLIAIGPISRLKNYYEQAKESRERPLHIMNIDLEDIIEDKKMH